KKPTYESVEELLESDECAIHYFCTKTQHPTDECYYLRPDLRPEGWEPGKEGNERLKELKKEHPGLAKAIKELQAANKSSKEKGKSKAQGKGKTPAKKQQKDDSDESDNDSVLLGAAVTPEVLASTTAKYPL